MTSPADHLRDLATQLKPSVAFWTINTFLGEQLICPAMKVLISLINISDSLRNHLSVLNSASSYMLRR